MRIIGGKFRGRKIAFPRFIRPTQDRVRESLFNVLAPVIEGKAVLELFAGSGAFGIEAVSRGAKHVTFVDNNSTCVKIIRENAEKIGIEDKIDILKVDAFTAVDIFLKAKKKFDIVFLDPPYYRGISKKILLKLSRCDIFARNALLIVEHSKRDLLPNIGNIILLKQKTFGNKALSFYKNLDTD